MANTFSGTVTVDMYELRFAYSGKLSQVRKKVGDIVNKWDSIASLDRKILQTELDRQLADYERTRADFEIFKIKNGSEGGDDTTKYLRIAKQAALNASVKDVELSKYKMDQSDLVSPIKGIIAQMDGMLAGINITPASNKVTIIPIDSLLFESTISQDDLSLVNTPQKGFVRFTHTDTVYEVSVNPPISGTNGTFPIRAVFIDPQQLLVGMKGSLTIST